MSDSELRRAFHDDVGRLRLRVESVGAQVVASIEMATTALLEADSATALEVCARDAAVDAAAVWVEREVFDLVARQAPVASDLRLVMATLRIAQDVERAGDLTASIAKRVGRMSGTSLDRGVRATIAEIGEESRALFEAAVRCYRVLDAEMAQVVIDGDDRVDELHRRLLRELFALAGEAPETLVELGLVARFYERIADHAVVIAERVRFAAVGEMNAGDADERVW
ncbi:MAG TPA: phosphate signaling complex protein PhoU [Acidimicrobiales bacterium]|nr:phosphate signaling complex protein PhoU [Acidimicrobiales bacterium]